MEMPAGPENPKTEITAITVSFLGMKALLRLLLLYKCTWYFYSFSYFRRFITGSHTVVRARIKGVGKRLAVIYGVTLEFWIFLYLRNICRDLCCDSYAMWDWNVVYVSLQGGQLTTLVELVVMNICIHLRNILLASVWTVSPRPARRGHRSIQSLFLNVLIEPRVSVSWTNSNTMPEHQGIAVCLISHCEHKQFPEFSHPDSSQFQRTTEIEPDDDKVHLSTPSKADKVLGRSPTISVYVPSFPGTYKSQDRRTRLTRCRLAILC